LRNRFEMRILGKLLFFPKYYKDLIINGFNIVLKRMLNFRSNKFWLLISIISTFTHFE